jgi:hypothetical protein
MKTTDITNGAELLEACIEAEAEADRRAIIDDERSGGNRGTYHTHLRDRLAQVCMAAGFDLEVACLARRWHEHLQSTGVTSTVLSAILSGEGPPA